MADGYGFGAEGDWKTAALLRAAKVMATGLPGGTSFMEDYTYDLAPGGERVLGAHMLEVCPSIAGGRPSCEIHPLSIGGREDPVRLVFTARPGPGGERGAPRPRRPLPAARQRGRRRRARPAAAAAAGRARAVEARSPTSRPPPRRGSSPAARTTPCSRRSSTPRRSPTSPRSRGSSSS